MFYNDIDRYPPIINAVRTGAQRGFRTFVICREGTIHWKNVYPAGVEILRVPRRGKESSFIAYGRFINEVFNAPQSESIIVGHDMHGFLPAYLLSRRLGLRVVFHCHDFADSNEVLGLGGRMVRAFQRRFAKKADLVIVPDKDRAAVIYDRLKLQKSPLIIANSPMKDAFDSVRDYLRPALVARGRCFTKVVLRQGVIGVGHAIEATIKSIRMWNEKSWGFVVLGYANPTYTEHLLNLCRVHGVTTQFCILPPVAYDEVRNFTCFADVGHALYEPIHVNNVHMGTASNKVMEYMAAGIPLLVSVTPGLVRVIQNHHCGVTADESDPASIAAGVNALLGNPVDANKMGRRGRSAFEDLFCFERQYDSFFTEIMDW